MKITFLDSETTGLLSNHSVPLDKQPEIIELYACEVNMETGEVLYEFDSLFKPVHPITDEITRITGIDDEMVQSAPLFLARADEIKIFLEGSDALCAHNLSFDKEMLEIEFERLGQKINWPKRLICSVEQSIFYKGYRLDLMSLHEFLTGKKFPEAHRAKNDVQALVRCALEMYKRRDI